VCFRGYRASAMVSRNGFPKTYTLKHCRDRNSNNVCVFVEQTSLPCTLTCPSQIISVPDPSRLRRLRGAYTILTASLAHSPPSGAQRGRVIGSVGRPCHVRIRALMPSIFRRCCRRPEDGQVSDCFIIAHARVYIRHAYIVCTLLS